MKKIDIEKITGDMPKEEMDPETLEIVEFAEGVNELVDSLKKYNYEK